MEIDNDPVLSEPSQSGSPPDALFWGSTKQDRDTVGTEF